MKKHDIAWMAFLAVSLVMMVGLMTENIRSVAVLRSPRVTIDIAKVKAEIEQAGLVPYEAKYWKVLYKNQERK